MTICVWITFEVKVQKSAVSNRFHTEAGNSEATTEVTASFLRNVGARPVEEWRSTLRGEAERATEVGKGERELERVTRSAKSRKVESRM